jgi:hypothetical protein
MLNLFIRCSLQRRSSIRDLDTEALAFKSLMGSMLARVYNNPQREDDCQVRLEKILQFWDSKEVYDQETMSNLEREMKGGVPHPMEPQHPSQNPSIFSGISFRPHVHFYLYFCLGTLIRGKGSLTWLSVSYLIALI